jgi:nitrogen fixation protein FixH
MKILITLVSIFVVAFTVVTIVVGSRNFDGVVVDKPYETGLAWDETQEQKTKLGWTVSFKENKYRMGANDVLITVRDKAGRILRSPAVNVSISRPETVRYDKTYAAVLQPDGNISASIDLPARGNWTLIVSIRQGNDQAEFTYPIFAESNR